MAVAETPWTNAQKAVELWNRAESKATRTWRTVAAGAALLAAMSIVGNCVQSSRAKFSGYMVAIDSTGREIGNWPAGEPLKVTDDMIRARLSDWIVEARAVSQDQVVTRRYMERVFSAVGSGSPAQSFLKEYYSGGMGPLERSKTYTVDPQVESVVALSEKTYQVRWSETTKDMSGALQPVERWTAAITVAIVPATNPSGVVKLNGIGLFITRISWSRIAA